MSFSTTLLTRYQHKDSYSIFVAMLCVAVGMIGAIWFIYFIKFIPSCVTIGTLLGSTLGGLTGFLSSCCSIWSSLRVTLGGLLGFLHSGVFIGTSLGATLGGLRGFLVCVCTLGVGACCWCCIVGYLCVTCTRPWSSYFYTSHRRPLFLLVDCCSVLLGVMLNNSARFLSAVWCASLIVSKGAFGVGWFNASTKYLAASLAASEDDTLGVFIFWGKLHNVCNYFWSYFCRKHVVKTIVFQCYTSKPYRYLVFAPCCPLS